MGPATRIAELSWPAGPPDPESLEDAVHVWRADLAQAHEWLDALLCREEAERAARLLSERDRLRWMRARAVLRALLGRYLDIDPRGVQLVSGEYGKPELAQPQGGHERLRFNVSHSGALALYAFSDAGDVGVDVELARERPVDEVAIAARVLGEAHAERLRALDDPDARRREFLRMWTRHEARAKCVGTGIGAGSAGARERALWVAELELGAAAAGAVACARAPGGLRCWSWA